jgi:hypothetical protein
MGPIRRTAYRFCEQIPLFSWTRGLAVAALCAKQSSLALDLVGWRIYSAALTSQAQWRVDGLHVSKQIKD